MSKKGRLGIIELAVVAAVVSPGWPVSSTLAEGAIEFEARSIDGTGNNLQHPEFGGAGIPLLRMAPLGYTDGMTTPAGTTRRSPREVSNLMAAQEGGKPAAAPVSDFVWQWGQFLDHDLDLTTEAVPPEPFEIPIPLGDLFFDPASQGNATMHLNRSVYIGGAAPEQPRQQINQITAFIDASNVYGSDEDRAAALRTFERGKLATAHGDRFLPHNTGGLPNAGGSDPKLFLAGDVRANEQIALTAMHTLFVREHNRLCDEILTESPWLTDEDVYQRARKIVGAQMQVITYREFLPLVLGPQAIPSYLGYDADVNPGIANEFATAAYRFGHSLLSPVLLRMNRNEKEKQSIPLKDAFFNPRLLQINGGIDSLMRGLAIQRAQELDTKVVDGVRNFLFGHPGEGGFDLASLNIQRGRDHGLADYNTVRVAYGLLPASSFGDITSDPTLQAALAQAYQSPSDMDLWVAGLAEDHLPGSLLGKTFHAILTDQFVRLRDGDRFWYQNDPFFTSQPSLMEEMEHTTLAAIIRRNTGVAEELQEHVFVVQ